MSVPEFSRPEMGPCSYCSAPTGSAMYRTAGDLGEARITGLCQACIDLCFLAGGPDDLRSNPIHDGAVVAARAFRRRVADLALLPFRLVVPASGSARLVWEARHLLRAGPWLNPMDVRDVRYQLEPMAPLLARHQVCVHAYRDFRDPCVSARLDSLCLLIALDERALDAVARVCHLPEPLALATFDEVPWRSAFGRPLRPLESWWAPEPGPLSTVRVLALLGRLLLDEGREGLRPLDYLVASRRARFEDESDG